MDVIVAISRDEPADRRRLGAVGRSARPAAAPKSLLERRQRETERVREPNTSSVSDSRSVKRDAASCGPELSSSRNTKHVVNAEVTYQRLRCVAAAPATIATATTLYTSPDGLSRTSTMPATAPTATATIRPTRRRRCISAAGRITSSAAAHAHPTCSRSSANPIAAAVAPAAPSRIPYASVGGAWACAATTAGKTARSGQSSDTRQAYTEPSTISPARAAALPTSG